MYQNNSSAIFEKRVQRASIFLPSALQPRALPTTPSGLRIQFVKVLYFNQINMKNSHVTFNSKKQKLRSRNLSHYLKDK